MKDKKEFLKPVAHIRGGVKPAHCKNTEFCKTETMPAPKKVLIPLAQHIGVPCLPTVSIGDEVFVGTVIGDSEKYMSAPIHSSVSGKVTAFKKAKLPNGAVSDAIEIENDENQTPDPTLEPHPVKDESDIVKAARDMGLVGLGGAGFPTHIKLTRHPDKPIDTLIINGAECEPYITADCREALEYTEDVLEGVYTLLEIMHFKQAIIAVEDNKPEVLDALYTVAASRLDTDNRVKITVLKSRYPQGAEKVLIYSVTGRKLALGQLPADVGCIVMNITSIAALNRYIKTGMPLVRKRLTVDGDAVNTPKNVSVPIGALYADVADFCGGLKDNCDKVIVGGPMMGFSVDTLFMPVIKQNNALLFFGKETAYMPKITACIRCGKCKSACPMNLTPYKIAGALKRDDVSDLEKYGANYCMECGSCAFSCPAKRPIVQVMRQAKAKLRGNRK